MAENPFDIGDAERILRAIFPQIGEDPLGHIRDQIIKVREDQLAFEQGYDADTAEIFEQLEDINDRTFGILILQIFKTIKLLLGLLPAGKFILLAIAALGLLSQFLEGDTPTGKDIRDAVESSGLGEFIRDQVKAITAVANEQADRVETVIDLGSDVAAEGARLAETLLVDLEFFLSQVNDATSSPEEVLSVLRATLPGTADRAFSLANLTANTESIIFDALRIVPEKIRTIPIKVLELMD